MRRAVLHAFVVPVIGDPIPDGAVVWEGGVITWIGSTSDAVADEVWDAGGALLTPGLIDAHTHLVFGGDRVAEFGMRCAGASYEAVAGAGGGIRSSMRQTCGCPDLEDQVRLRLRQCLRSGTTALEVKSGYGTSPLAEVDLLRRARASFAEEGMESQVHHTYLGAHAVPEGSAEDYMERVIAEGLPAASLIAQSVDVFVEEGYFGPELIPAYAARARELGLHVRLHVDQMRDGGGAALAARVGARTADHLEYTSSAGIAALRESGVAPVLLPGSVLGLGQSHYPNARAMLEAGLPVVLATDFNPGSSPVWSLTYVMGLACRMMKMSPAEALRGCTVNAAATLGWGGVKGQLTPGAHADLVLWDAQHPDELAYWMPGPDVQRVWVAGEVRV